MSSETNRQYENYIKQLGLTEEQGKDLIGALQCLIENLLDKKYLLENRND